jgi:hypothetical protein
MVRTVLRHGRLLIALAATFILLADLNTAKSKDSGRSNQSNSGGPTITTNNSKTKWNRVQQQIDKHNATVAQEMKKGKGKSGTQQEVGFGQGPALGAGAQPLPSGTGTGLR